MLPQKKCQLVGERGITTCKKLRDAIALWPCSNCGNCGNWVYIEWCLVSPIVIGEGHPSSYKHSSTCWRLLWYPSPLLFFNSLKERLFFRLFSHSSSWSFQDSTHFQCLSSYGKISQPSQLQEAQLAVVEAQVADQGQIFRHLWRELLLAEQSHNQLRKCWANSGWFWVKPGKLQNHSLSS